MRNLIVILFISGLFAGHLIAQDSIPDLGNTDQPGQTKAGHGQRFVDEDGDGYNDNAPDHDGDGIPNGLDPDWTKHKNEEFIDLDGDGINDNIVNGKGAQKQYQYGPMHNREQTQGTPEMKTEEQKQQHQERRGKQRNQ